MPAKLTSFRVPLASHLLSGFVHHTRPMWIGLAELETRSVSNELEDVWIDRPVYVTGLARAGTTILLEFLARHPDVVTHKYRDFPGVFVPVWWERGHRKRNEPLQPQERAHGDGLAVTPDSPEAIEECLWMAFFPYAHQPDRCSVLNATCSHPRFEKFYRDHIRKLLLVRAGQRYIAKGNYNLTRLQYLLKLFRDARFVVAIRHPRNHVASLMKQHRLFCNGEANSPRALAYMQRVGHYEFGLDRRLINVGRSDEIREIQRLFDQGEEARGWARYWSMLYGWTLETLHRDGRLRSAVELVRYEDLCNQPHETLQRIQEHCQLSSRQVLNDFAEDVAAPKYYEPEFTASEEQAIAEETRAVATALGFRSVDSISRTASV